MKKNNAILDAILNEFKDKEGASFVFFSECNEDTKPFLGINFKKGENTNVFARIQEICEQSIENKLSNKESILTKARKFIETIKKPNIQQYIAFNNGGNDKKSNIQITSGNEKTFKLIRILHAELLENGVFHSNRTRHADKIINAYFDEVLKQREYSIDDDSLKQIATRPKDISISRMYEIIKERIRNYFSLDKDKTRENNTNPSR